jgi:hypothetical protein
LAFNAPAADPLPSWNDGAVKQSIVAFVQAVTTEGGVKFVPPAERIAVFDNDGTLWAEHPMYFQLLFALDRVKALAPQHGPNIGSMSSGATAGADLRIRLDRKELISVMFLTRGSGKQGCDYLCFAGTTHYFRSSR